MTTKDSVRERSPESHRRHRRPASRGLAPAPAHVAALLHVQRFAGNRAALKLRNTAKLPGLGATATAGFSVSGGVAVGERGISADAQASGSVSALPNLTGAGATAAPPADVGDQEAQVERDPTQADDQGTRTGAEQGAVEAKAKEPDGSVAARPSPAQTPATTAPAAPAAAENGVAAFKKKAGRAGRTLKKKPKPTAHVSSMKAAAKGPTNEKMAGGKAAQVGDMEAAPEGAFDRAGFIAAVEKAIAAQAPKSLEDADEMADSGKMEKVKGAVGERVGANKEAATGAVDSAATAAPNPARGQEKPVAAMPPPPKVKRPGRLGAKAAMPKKKPAAATDLSKEPKEVAGQLEEEGITEEQLANSEEPQFVGALDAKKSADTHSKEAPGPVRTDESNILASARGAAAAQERSGTAGMQQARVEGDNVVHTLKGGSKGKDEGARKKVADHIESIYSSTQAEATAILNGLDAKVSEAFDRGEADARRQFEGQHKREMRAWKNKRYSGWLGGGRWLKDKLLDPPAEANRIFDRARQLYLRLMKGVIGTVADIVVRELTAAKKRIVAGRKEIADYVASLPNDLQQIGAELGEGVQSKFDELDANVESKQGDMVQAVAGKYKDAKEKVDARVEELKAANRGLWGRAKAAIQGVIDTIRRLKDALMSALKTAGQAISAILRSPKTFFGNLIKAIGLGLDNFVKNIGGHLKKGLFAWLTGEMGSAGIQMPDTFDLKGIIGLIMQVLGLTWSNIRMRIVKKLGPRAAKVIGMVESGIGIIGRLVSEGPIALWKMISEKVTNLWDMVVGKLKEFLIVKVLTAGITWLIGLLNPVAGFIKICKAIVDLVMWFWNNASRISELIKTIAGSALSIAKGAIGAAANAVEGVLSRLLPLAIGFLASLLGLGGLADKVKAIVKTVRRPINKVIDTVVGKAVKFGRKLLGTGLGKKLVGGVKKGMAFAKKKIGQAKEWGQKKVQGVKKRLYGGDDSPEGKSERLRLAMDSAVIAVNKYAGKKVRRLTLDPKLKAIKIRRGIGYLDVKPAGDKWAVVGRVDRAEQLTDAEVSSGAEDVQEEVVAGAPDVNELVWVDAGSGIWEVATYQGSEARSGLSLLRFVRTNAAGKARGSILLLPADRKGSWRPYAPGDYRISLNPLASGRATGGKATLVKARPTGSKASSSIRPPGFKSSKHDRGHLIAATFGGPGNDPRNIVPLFKRTNKSDMKSVENDARAAIERGDIVEYRVDVTYGDGEVPNAITIEARGQSGFKRWVSLLNRE